MNIDQYPVTTPFGQVPGYPLNGGFHQGIDYGLPMGTPVIVNGVQIGLSNNTGASTGPHLHVGKFVGGHVEDPGVGNGFSFDSAVVYDTGSDATNGNFVRVSGDGALWNYLHLQEINVTAGQELKGGSMDEVQHWKDVADARLTSLKNISKTVSVDYQDGNDDAQVIANIKTEQAQIDSLTKLAEDRANQIKDLEAQLVNSSPLSTPSTPPISPPTPTSPALDPAGQGVNVTETGLWAAFKRFLGIK